MVQKVKDIYYCENCGANVIIPDEMFEDNECPLCGKKQLKKV